MKFIISRAFGNRVDELTRSIFFPQSSDVINQVHPMGAGNLQRGRVANRSDPRVAKVPITLAHMRGGGLYT